MQKLTLPSEILTSLNKVFDLAKAHWSKYYDFQQKTLLIISSYIKQQNLRPIEKYPVKIQFRFYCSDRRRDPDNLSSSSRKFILDALVNEGVLKDDGWKYIKGFSDDFYLDKNNPRIEVTIRKSQ